MSVPRGTFSLHDDANCTGAWTRIGTLTDPHAWKCVRCLAVRRDINLPPDETEFFDDDDSSASDPQ